ncbi:transposase [Bernardetia litoralis DSM 6794]|uniref:Transposase n=1 Tax=Bernardetia litoralis (strain ATCC 23117 / DSM 6794 / NBRC 15988 / NCIMB 1366 / Fx l1 / Sio-4) TaxID=880071 RepID=I4APC0_BERLS|nr:transposase [Bernardetia litoralis]AFM05805.1 transposase [Bernardetia litoralis DSM 6794]
MTSATDLYEHRYIAFFTATTLNWKYLLRPDKYKDLILKSLEFLVTKQRIELYGFVIMPNHIHLLWRIVPPYTKEEVQRDFLKYISQHIKKDLKVHHPDVLERFKVNLKDRKYQFWQQNPLTVYCYDDKMIAQKLDYIHANPIKEKWNLASTPESYYYSSASFYTDNKEDFSFLTSCWGE